MTLKFRKIEKQDPSVTYTGAWTGLSGGSEVELESPSTESYGYGTLRNTILVSATGSSGVALVQGTDFQYNSYIDDSTVKDIYDDSSSGSLASGASIRIVENGKNITDDTGLNLRVRAKNLNTIIAPPATECYVDPLTGKFVLPRPVYWSKCNSFSNLIDAEIKENDPEYSSNAQESIIQSGGKFNNYCLQWNSYSSQQIHLYPISSSKSLDSGTISFWYVHQGEFVSRGCQLQIQNKGIRVLFDSIGGGIAQNTLYIDDISRNTNNTVISSANGWHHIYMVWDKAGLASGKTIRLFLNGIEILSATVTWTNSAPLGIVMTNANRGEDVSTRWMDNIKLWNYPVEDPSWEYNGGTGREEALHAIYGSANGYKPYNLQVGYKYLASSTTPATCPAPGANEQVELESASNISYGAGKLGAIQTSIKKVSTYAKMVENTDYVYGKRLDASTTEDAADGFGTTAGGVVDTGDSGDLTKNFRIVENAVNIKGTLGLKVYAKDLSTIVSPPADRIYVDPKRSKFVLPRPIFWSKLEDANSEIGSYNVSGRTYSYYTSISGNVATITPKFNKSLGINSSTLDGTYGVPLIIQPNIQSLSKGTISFWLSGGLNTIQFPDPYYMYIHIHFTNTDFLQFGTWGSSGGYNEGYEGGIFINNIKVDSLNIPFMTASPAHWYVVYDKTIGVKLYRGGTLLKTFTNTWSLSATPYIKLTLHVGANYTTQCCHLIDNLKIWQDYIDNPDWEYNSGTGREDALHPIYGSSSGYKPTNLQVGYHKAGGDGVFSKWSL